MAVRRRYRLALFRWAAAVTAAAAAAVAPPPAAAAAAACGGAVFRDWLDGRIANVYEPRCYREALDALPEDVRTYSTAQEDIQRALVSRLRNLAAASARQTAIPAETAPAEPKRALAGAGGKTGSPRREAAAPVAAARPADRPVLLFLAAAAGIAAAAAVALFALRRRYAARGSSAGKRERIQAASSGARR